MTKDLKELLTLLLKDRKQVAESRLRMFERWERERKNESTGVRALINQEKISINILKNYQKELKQL
jgi:hypothetical protein